MLEKIKVLAIVPNRGGVGFFRSIRPHVYLDEFYSDDFEITMIEAKQFDFKDPEFGLEFDIIHFHVTVGANYENWVLKMKQLQHAGVKLVNDLDDFWVLPEEFENYQEYKNGKTEKIKTNIKLSDHITTTTEIFASEIRKLNKNVTVIPNAIDPREKQFLSKDNKSDRLRLGIVCGSSHEEDIKLLEGVVNILKPEMDKLQFVLCGFDLNGVFNYLDKEDGKIKQRPIKPSESVWTKYERILTDNYSIVSEDYKKYLMEFNSLKTYPDEDNMPYKRCWTKPISTYGTHYNNIDILLIPLDSRKFGECKSQLKVVEAAFTGKNVIASNFGPYTIDLKNAYLKGGIIDETGNSLMVDNTKNPAKDWVKAIKLLLNNPDLREKLKNNLSNDITTKYNLGEVSKIRAELYKKLGSK